MTLRGKVEAAVRRAVADGRVSWDSDVARVPFVGAWLSGNMSDLVTGSRHRVSLEEVLTFISQAPAGPGARARGVSARIGLLCQNNRRNACVASDKSRRREASQYAVRDANKGCALALPSALLSLPASENAQVTPVLAEALTEARNGVTTRGTGLVAGSPRSAAAECPCFQQDDCAGPLCTWHAADGGQCLPQDPQSAGFEGVPPYDDQRIRPDVPHLLVYGPPASSETTPGRAYAWRRPTAPLPALTRVQQDLGLVVPLRLALETRLARRQTDALAAEVARLSQDAADMQALQTLLRSDRRLRSLIATDEWGEALAFAKEVVSKRAAEMLRQKAAHVGPAAQLGDLLVDMSGVEREMAERLFRSGASLAARPAWKRRIPTRQRTVLKQALQRHAAAHKPIDAVLADVAADPQVQEFVGPALTAKAKEYVVQLWHTRHA